ncbi:MAG: ParB/RepB/Spo0J family partition protein [Candidatus Acidiferrales bacterium]
MKAIEPAKFSNEYGNVAITELTEFASNPRKAFDEAALEELAQSIRSHGVLSPLVVRRVNGHLEIVSGARRYRAAQRAGLREIPVRLLDLSDGEAQELQIIENVQRADVHPFEEAQGFQALLDRAGGEYSIETIAARTGKSATHVAKRLKLLSLAPRIAEAFSAGRIGVEHAQLIAKLAPDAQETALAHCFDGYFAGDDRERSLVPASRVQAWIAQNIYFSLKTVPFSKDDETLLPEAGSCSTCPKRTGFNTLLFSDVREDCCSDATCFNRKLDAHIAQRKQAMPGLVLISERYDLAGESEVLALRNYVEVIARKAKKGKHVQPDERLCDRLSSAIFADGIDKGRLVKVCADKTCPIHFQEQQQQEKQRAEWRAERAAAKRKAKQTLSLRHGVLAEVVKRVKAPFGCDELRIVARFVLRSLSHDLAGRLAKRHGLDNPNDPHDWHAAEKARNLHRRADAAGLAALIFEAMLVGSAGDVNVPKEDDLLADAARLCHIDVQRVRKAVAKDERANADKKAIKSAKDKPGRK